MKFNGEDDEICVVRLSGKLKRGFLFLFFFGLHLRTFFRARHTPTTHDLSNEACFTSRTGHIHFSSEGDTNDLYQADKRISCMV